MPANYLKALIARERSQKVNRHLGALLALIAGAVNAGGLVILGQFSSHVTGALSRIGLLSAQREMEPLIACSLLVLSFLAGSVGSSLLIIWGRRRHLHSQYAAAVLAEALLLGLFGVFGAALDRMSSAMLPLPVMLLCLSMGLQNAMITKLSNAEVRTTHMTGILTDIGIELGKMLYWNRDADGMPVVANWQKLKTLSMLLLMFVAGAGFGGMGFAYAGYAAALPLAGLLCLLSLIPITRDLLSRFRVKRDVFGDTKLEQR
jgi:uncharacterized membrane protein YoaK (UPF0700 family)